MKLGTFKLNNYGPLPYPSSYRSNDELHRHPGAGYCCHEFHPGIADARHRHSRNNRAGKRSQHCRPGTGKHGSQAASAAVDATFAPGRHYQRNAQRKRADPSEI